MKPGFARPLAPRAIAPSTLRCLIVLAVLVGVTEPARAAVDRAAAASHWAFLPPVRPPLPTVRERHWARTPIDQFILAALESHQLAPAPEADRETLIRRLTFALTGLPPTPGEVRAFLQETSPDAYDQLVERLLSSPHYGERWGRHWLDIAGYSDSNGYFHADTDRPLAYRYRDYVIRSMNADKPLDQFIREQIAGDELSGFDPEGDLVGEKVEFLVATHFLRNGPDGTGESDGNPQEQTADRYAVLESAVQILGSTFLGLTVQCARCHDHKFEPVSQEEYYQLQAILRPAYDPDQWRKPNDRVVELGPVQERRAHQQELQRYNRELKALRESLDGLTKPFQKLTADANLARLPETQREEIKSALQRKESERTAADKALLKKHEALLNPSAEDIAKARPELAPAYQALQQAIQKKEKEKPAGLPRIAVLTEPSGKAPAHHILKRGNYMQPGAAVNPGVPAILSQTGNVYDLASVKASSSGRRTALANWLTAPQQPSVARLFVDRVWRAHFGAGLLSTPGNIGVTGQRPLHPELLDYLAVDLVQSGWRLKHLQRLIVRSSVFRQSNQLSAPGAQNDPDDLYLSRFPLRRLDAESIRDAMLAVSGELDRTLEGPFVRAKANADGEVVVPENDPGVRRRSLYLQQRRTQPVGLLDVFDGGRMDPNCVARGNSAVPLQSLALLNSEFVRRRSSAFAQQLLRSGEATIDRAFAKAIGRPPRDIERRAADEFLRTQRSFYPEGPALEERVWTDFCQMLLASDTFLYVE